MCAGDAFNHLNWRPEHGVHLSTLASNRCSIGTSMEQCNRFLCALMLISIFIFSRLSLRNSATNASINFSQKRTGWLHRSAVRKETMEKRTVQVARSRARRTYANYIRIFFGDTSTCCLRIAISCSCGGRHFPFVHMSNDKIYIYFHF